MKKLIMLMVLVLSFSPFVFAAWSEITSNFVINTEEVVVDGYIPSADYSYTLIWIVAVVLLVFFLLRKKRLNRKSSKTKKVSKKMSRKKKSKR